jgi:hypothetical protein
VNSIVNHNLQHGETMIPHLSVRLAFLILAGVAQILVAVATLAGPVAVAINELAKVYFLRA